MAIDTASRQRAAELLSRWLATGISNYELEDRWPKTSVDAGLTIIEALDPYYDDFPEKVLKPQDLSSELKACLERCVLFLREHYEYQWPPFEFGWREIPVLDKLIRKNTRWEEGFEKLKEAGDFSVWPFISKKDYLEALRIGEEGEMQ